jgi:pyridoxal phosphate enzyme (YggS family)
VDPAEADLGARLAAVRASLAAAARAAGRAPDEVTLVAVSKGHPAEVVRAAWAAGQRVFGESYALELRDKATALADLAGLRWHFIGHLQRNKVRHVVGRAALIHAIDDAELAAAVAARAAGLGMRQAVLLQVNVAGDPAKRGCPPAALSDLIAAARALDHLEVLGLMTLPPQDAPRGPIFTALAQLAARHWPAPARPLLSMGMSEDHAAAVAAGATHVRVGTAIFGERSPAPRP